VTFLKRFNVAFPYYLVTYLTLPPTDFYKSQIAGFLHAFRVLQYTESPMASIRFDLNSNATTLFFSNKIRKKSPRSTTQTQL